MKSEKLDFSSQINLIVINYIVKEPAIVILLLFDLYLEN
ncbi:hypothetical protein ABIC59_004943 [Priestia aryabhattai]